MFDSFFIIRYNFHFAIFTGLLLALSWMNLFFGVLLVIAFIPLFHLEDLTIKKAYKKRIYFANIFIAMFVWHILTLNWVIAMNFKNGIIISIVNSLLISIFLLIPHILKRTGKTLLSYAAFICFWVTQELLHLNWELSFPLMILGNGLGIFPQLIQWYEWTGVMGGSIWILTLNILFYEFIKDIYTRLKTKTKIKVNCYFIGLLFIPISCSLIRFYTYQEAGKSIEVVAIHPNINCYTEKYNWTTDKLQNRYLDCTLKNITKDTDYVIWPENAITNTEWLSDIENFLPFQEIRNRLSEYKKAKIITGGISYNLYSNKIPNKEVPINVKYSEKLDQFYFTYNAAFIIEQDKNEISMRSKSKLVPFEESIPYPRWAGYLRKISGSLGGFTFSVRNKNKDVFIANDGSKSTSLICYESAFGAHTSNYVRQGAQVLFVLLNEGWYRDLQGAKQFLYISAIRAIETRRSIARSSNDGITAFINQRGEILQQVTDYKPSSIKQSLFLNSKTTLYVYLKDLLAKLCAFCALFLSFYTASLVYKKL